MPNHPPRSRGNCPRLATDVTSALSRTLYTLRRFAGIISPITCFIGLSGTPKNDRLSHANRPQIPSHSPGNPNPRGAPLAGQLRLRAHPRHVLWRPYATSAPSSASRIRKICVASPADTSSSTASTCCGRRTPPTERYVAAWRRSPHCSST